MWNQIGNISNAHLNAEQSDWLDRVDSDLYSNFVEITDGDAGEARMIDTSDIRSPEQVVADIESGSLYGYIVVDGVAFPEIADRIAKVATEESKAFYSNERMFYVQG